MADRVRHPGIEERRDRHGRIRYRVRVRRAGRMIYETLPSLKAALAWQAQALDAIDGAGPMPEPLTPPPVPPPSPAAMTVLDAARILLAGMDDGALRNKRGEPYKPSAFRAYETSLRLYVLPALASMPVAALTRGDAQRFADGVAATASPDAARKALTALRVVIRVAERYGGELQRDPCHGVTVPTTRMTRRRPAQRLTVADVERIVVAADADDERHGRSLMGPLVRLLAGSGLRLGEALALTWGREGLDLDARLVHVTHSLEQERGRDGRVVVHDVKSAAGARVVPIGADLATALRRHRLATGRRPDGGLVFAGASGEPYRGCGAPRHARLRMMRAAGFAEPTPTFHDLRHAYATLQLARGATLHEVAELLGHADAGLVARL
jgi:integrase